LNPNNPLLILGLGNIICQDDGVGVLAVETLAQHYGETPGVRILDGGTLGLSLLSHIQDSELVILVDAIEADEPPGTLIRLEGEEVEPAVRYRLSVHQIGVADLLDGLRLLGAMPPKLILLGLVPVETSLGLGLTPAVKDGMPELIAAVVDEAASLGHPLLRGEPDVTALPSGRYRACVASLGL
jgi:hydrogenase maturation protease